MFMCRAISYPIINAVVIHCHQIFIKINYGKLRLCVRARGVNNAKPTVYTIHMINGITINQQQPLILV